MRHDDWSKALVGGVAETVRFHRKRRRMSAQQLADECSRLGYPLPRSVLTNLENGRRDTVSIAELLVLSAALRVSPILLLFPLGRVETVEPLPDTPSPTWDAVRWVMGKQEFPERPERTGDGNEILYEDETIGMFQLHEFQVDHVLINLRAAATKAAKGRPDGLPADANWTSATEHEERVRTMANALDHLRRRMRKAGLIPPPLPNALIHIDNLRPHPPSIKTTS